MKIHGSVAAPVNQRLLISPVESVGDDVVVHKLPSPAEFNRDVELENTEADRSETRGRTPLFQPEGNTRKRRILVYSHGVKGDFSLTGRRARACLACRYYNSIPTLFVQHLASPLSTGRRKSSVRSLNRC